MTTAEYAVGTLGACTIAAALVHVGAGDWFVDILQEVLAVALDPSTLLDLIGPERPYIRNGP